MKKVFLILIFCVLITPFVHSKVIENPLRDSADKATAQTYSANLDNIDKESKAVSSPTAANLIFMGIIILSMASLSHNNILKKK